MVINLIVVIFLASNFAFGKLVKGKVFGIDEQGNKTPLQSATIKIMNSNKGTFTNSNGEFQIDLNPPTQIVISYIGYKQDTVLVDKSKDYVEVILKQELTSEEVVVEAKQPDYYLEKASPVKTEVISASGLKKAACCNLSESFVTNPTVDVTYTDAVTGVKQIQLLGLAQNYTQLMVEIVPNLQGLASNYGLMFIPGPWMNSISISKGTSSVTRGYESITGQINVELKGPESEDAYLLNGYLNNILRFEGNVVKKFDLGNNWYLTNFLHGNYFNQKVDHNGDGFLDLPLNKQLNILERLDYVGEKFESKTFVHGLVNNSQSGQVNYFNNPHSNAFWGSDVNLRRFSFTTKNGYIFDKENYKSLGTILSFIHHKQNSQFGQRMYDAEQNSVFASVLWSSNVSLNSKEHSGANSSSINVVLGLSYSYNNYLQYLDSLNLSKTESVEGLISELTVEPFANLQLIAGARVDFHNLGGTLFTPRLHLKYTIDDNNTLRFSVGKGYHFPLPIPENQNVLSSSRQIIFAEDLKMEEAWNFGVNSSHNFEAFGRYFQLNLEYYYTRFLNQTIVDRDISTEKIYIYNLKGKSYSHSFQIDLNFDLLDNLSLLTAYRLNYVWTTTNSTLQQKPLMSPHKALLNIAYKSEPYSFDFTVEFNGGGRIPNTKTNPEKYRMDDRFKPFVVLYGQISYKIGKFEIYAGAENITNFRQPNPILAPEAPYSNYFDGSLIWGPIDGRKIYIGFRFN